MSVFILLDRIPLRIPATNVQPNLIQLRTAFR